LQFGTLPIYKIDNDKSRVVLSSWFLQTYNTITNNKLFWILKEDYDVYGIDNVWHGIEKNNKFTIDNQKSLILSIVKLANNPIHIISNSFPWIFITHALQNLLSHKDTKELVVQKIKSLTLLAPAMNSLWALDADFAKRNFIIQALYKTWWWRKYILNFILNNIKWVNADLDMLYDWSKDDMRFKNNLKTIVNVSRTIPTHIVFNTGDKAVLQKNIDSDREILEILKKVSEKENWNIWYTYTNENRHAVYLQDSFTSSSVLEKNQLYTVWQSIKQFINNNN
jgi:hypothetical protein